MSRPLITKLAALLQAQGLNCLEQIDMPAREPRNATLGNSPGEIALSNALVAMGADPTLLWSHQAFGLAQIAAGQNLVLATATASGKSLVFQAAIIADLEGSDCTHLVFYPQKALAADQKHRWQSALAKSGREPHLVAEVNGDIAVRDRELAVAQARVLLVTPDVVHAWLMRNLDHPDVQQFLRRLKFIVLDEAHALDGPFGSSAAFLLRRLLLARALLAAKQPVQFIAATATIANPKEHLEALTGEAFVSLEDAENGAPRALKTILHLGSSHQVRAMESQVANLATALPQLLRDDAFIIFADSRQGVERITRMISNPNVLPYRNGYEADDRRRIEEALRQGRLHGVIATSAMELGIDIPQFVLGINLGLPMSRKAFHQRLGRIGRAKPSAFIVMAPDNAFASLGTTFTEYFGDTVEPSQLYLENRFIQYAQARCLLEEQHDLAETSALLEHWPMGFDQAIQAARPGGMRPADLDQLAMAGGNNPHLNYPLRQIASETIELRLAGANGDRIGTIANHQAIREAYPGSTYYHLQRPFKVVEWRLSSYERSIRLRAVRDAEPTQPLLRQWVNGSLSPSELLDGRLLQCAAGSLAEASLQVVEAVEGIRSDGGTKLYRDLVATNPCMRRQQRDFATTGVLLQIAEPWFAGSTSEQASTRKAIAGALTQLLCRERSIAPTELSFAYTNVALCTAHGPRKVDDTIAVYDNVRGGLRLSGPLLELLPSFAARLQLAARIAGSEAMVDATTAERFAAWVNGLSPATLSAPSTIEVPEGQMLIFSPGSEVSVRTKGQVLARRIIEPKMLAMPDGEHLFYRYELEQGVTGWVAHDAVEPLGQSWQRAFWNPVTNEMRALV